MKINYGFEICEREETETLVLCNGWTSYAWFNGSVWKRFPEGWANFPDLVIPSDDEILARTNNCAPSDEFLKSILDEYSHKNEPVHVR